MDVYRPIGGALQSRVGKPKGEIWSDQCRARAADSGLGTTSLVAAIGVATCIGSFTDQIAIGRLLCRGTLVLVVWPRSTMPGF